MFSKSFFLAGVLAAALVSSAGDAAELSAWQRAAAPLPATGSFVPPPPELAADVPDAFESYALYEDYSGGGFFDEVRLGVLGFWQQNATSEEGVYVTGQVLFDPFLQPFDNWFVNILLRPRPHIGGNASFDGTDQLFAGLTWTIPIWRALFAEASFGGTIHNGPLKNAEVALGCRVLFRESLALGLKVNEHWRVVAGVDHSSHAELCGQENDGLTHAGVSLGYRF